VVCHFCTLVLMLALPTIVAQDLVPLPTFYSNASLYILAAGITVSVRVQASRGCVYGVKATKVYDYFLTLKQEISYVWSCPRSIGLALFYISRYLIFIDQPLMLYVELPAAAARSPRACSALSSLSIVSMMVGFMSSQAIITLRTCAMWGRRLWVLVILGTLTTITFGFSLYTMVSVARSIISVNHTTMMPGCKFPATGKFYVAWFCLTTLTEFTIVSLTVTKAYQHLRQSTSDWLNQLYRNGIFYSVCVLLLSIVNLLMFALTLPPQYESMMVFPTRVAHSIIGNRVMLLLVEHRHQTLQQNLESVPSIPEFGLPTNLDVFLTTFDVEEELSNEPNSRAGTLEVEWIT